MSLSSEHAYVVIRAQESGRWTAGLGLGGHHQELRGSWATPEGAELAAAWAWRRGLDARLEFLRQWSYLLGATDQLARVEPRDRPLVIRVVGPGWTQDYLPLAQPSRYDGRLRPDAGTTADERRALQAVREGRSLRASQRRALAELLERVRDEGTTLFDEELSVRAAIGAGAAP